jgi:hypothetical protein
MATKTVIARPSSTISFSTPMNTIPSGTSFNSTYTLINEEIADGDSTYVYYPVPGTVNTWFSPEFGFKIPTALQYGEYLDIKSLKVVALISANNSQSTTKSMTFTVNLYNDDVVMHSETKTVDCSSYSAISEYHETVAIFENICQTMVNDFDIDHETAIIGIKLDGSTYIGTSSKNNGQTVGVSFQLTQLYIEFTYEQYSKKIYLKKDGSWEEIQGTVFIKQNGSWTLSDRSIFNNGDKYIVEYDKSEDLGDGDE